MGRIPLAVRCRRLLFRAAEAVAPGPTVNALERHLLTPANFYRQAPETDDLDGQPFTVPHDDHHLRAWSWGEGPVVLLIHGWGSRASHMRGWVGPLCQAGFRVVAYDAPAHGESTGRRTNLLECSDAVGRVAETVGPVHGVVAHSFGTAAVARAVRRGARFERMVFVATPVDVSYTMSAAARAMGLPDTVVARIFENLARRLEFTWDELRTDYALAENRTPLLLIHDHHDKEIPHDDSRTLARTLPHAQLLSTSGLGHRRITRDAEVQQQGAAFLRTS